MVPVGLHDIEPCTPLPWHLFDGDGHLVAERDRQFGSEEELALLWRDGPLFRDRLHTPASASSHAFGTRQTAVPALKSGTVLQARRRDLAAADVYRCRFIGTLDDTLFVSLPQAMTGGAAWQVGDPISFRTFSGKDIYAFTATVSQTCSAPTGFVVLNRLSAVARQPLRSAQRVQTRIAATIRYSADAASGPLAMVNDLSATGALLRVLQTDLRPRQEVILGMVLDLPEGHEDVSLSGTIVTANQSEHPLLALAFDRNMDVKQRALLHRCVAIRLGDA